MMELLVEFQRSTSSNLTVIEAIALLLLAILAWKGRRKAPVFPVLYSAFLIFYITLLRRAPGYNEAIRIHLQFWESAGIFIGNFLNLALYMPLGITVKIYWKSLQVAHLTGLGVALSGICEALQYATGRGTADVNDVIFNTLGMTLGGVVIARTKVLSAFAQRANR